MRSLIAFSALLAMCVAVVTAATGTDHSATDITNPVLASLKFPDGGKIVEAHPVGDDTVLEEGAEHDIESSDAGKPELVADEKPVTHTMDNVNLPDSELDSTPAVKLAVDESKNSKVASAAEAIGTAASRGYKPYCPATCSLYRKYCSRGCARKYCIIRYRIKYRIRRRYRVKYAVRVRRTYRIRVKYCTKHGYKPYCYYRWVYKHVYVTVYRYKIVYRYTFLYKYKYRKGIKCVHY